MQVYLIRANELALLKLLTSKAYPKNILLVGRTGVGKSIIVENFTVLNKGVVTVLDLLGAHHYSESYKVYQVAEDIAKKVKTPFIYIKGFDRFIKGKDLKEVLANLEALKGMGSAFNKRFIVNLDCEEGKIRDSGYEVINVNPIDKDGIMEVIGDSVGGMLAGSSVRVEGKSLEDFIKKNYDGNIDAILDKVDTLIVTARVLNNGLLDEMAVEKYKDTFEDSSVSSVEDAPFEALKGIRERIESRLIGQEEAVEKVVRAIKRNKAGVRLGNRPIGTFLFVGPTGVGKTELVKVLAKELNGDANSIIRFDMSEFSEGHSVSKLVGSPPGYIGHDDGGQLTKRIAEKPESILLFDEIEKAHGNIYNMLLQVMDEGRLTDSKGVTVDFTKAIIVMTSNDGYSSEVSGKRSIGFSAVEFDENKLDNEQVINALESTFRPEFLNRIDSVVKFNRLRYEEILRISKLILGDVVENLNKKGYNILVDEGVYGHISKAGFSDKYGARNIKRAIQEEVEDYLADRIIDGEVDKGAEYKLGVADGKVQFI